MSANALQAVLHKASKAQANPASDKLAGFFIVARTVFLLCLGRQGGGFPLF